MNPDTPVKTFRIAPFAVSLLITLGIGIVASLFTRPEIATWYSKLNKPSFTPPNWLFPVAWTTLYVMIAIAAYIVWQHRDRTVRFVNTRVIYIAQLLLNFSWSIVFFGMHQILAALVVIVLLLILIALNIRWFGSYSRTAAWLLVPYLLWVSYATALNLSIYILNK